MSFVCQNCGKKSVMGRSQRHHRGVAGKRWAKRAQATPKLFRPNLQWTTLTIGGVRRRMRLCTKCIKKFKKDNRIERYAASPTL